MLFVPTIILALLQLFLCLLLVVLLLRTKDKLQIGLFILISLSLTIWTIINTILLIDTSDSTKVGIFNIVNYLGFFMGAISLIQIYNFTFYYPELIQRSVKQKLFIVLLSIVALISFFSVISGYHIYDQTVGKIEYVAGSLQFIYVTFAAFLIGLFFRNLQRAKKLNPEYDKQINTMLKGLVLTGIHGLFFIIILPVFIEMGNTLYAIGYLAPAYFVFATSYNLVRHQLFDFKSVLIRVASYLVVLSFVLLIYVIIFYGLLALIVPDVSISRVQLIIDVCIGIFLVASFPYIKELFNKFTNKLFYRDLYDPQEFLGQLNRTIVSDVNLESLLTKTSSLIESNLKTTFCSFHLRDTAYFDTRLLGDEKKLNQQDFNELIEIVPKIRKRVILKDSEPETEEEKKVVELLKKTEVDALVRLVSTLEYEVAGVGNLLIGPKKNGSIFTPSDAQVLDIIANELVIAIENALRFEEIEQFNVTLQKKIDDATNQLKRSNDKLKALDEAKDEFVSMASHQLRTPLTSIKGYISMVVEGDAGEINDTQKQMLGQALFSSQRMVYLISDLLNVSRLKTGKFIIEAKPVYLPDLVESELSQLHEGAGAKNIKLEYDKPKEFPTLNLDEMKLRQVVMNFTDNAIYYTPAGGKITISLKDKKDTVEFTVKDTGIGVPKHEQHKLFAKFYRAENARKARPDGTGLGLFMAKKVIVAQGGSLIFESKEGKGSTFGFAFPKSNIEVKAEESKNEQ